MIVLDFDGTLVDVWERYYRVFSEGVVNQFALPGIKKYKEMKKRLRRDEDIASALGTKLVQAYFKDKVSKLESMEYLALDSCLLDDKSVGLIEQNRSLFVILTARKKPDLLHWEINKLGIPIPSSQVYVVNPDEKDAKNKWFQGNCGSVEMIVGDSASELLSIPDMPVLRIFVETGLFDYNFIVSRSNMVRVERRDSINSIFRTLI